MTASEFLASSLSQGTIQIGQILISKSDDGVEMRHYHDADCPAAELTTHHDEAAARDIGLYGPDGEYRFTKGQLDLIQGWRLIVRDVDEARRALDLFYPASLGLSLAWKDGRVRIQPLRDKLGRQTGMYRYAGTISDNGAQELVKTLCGPSNKCVKKILWQIDEQTPLEPSEASAFDGVVSDACGKKTIPMVCQEACNFFVAECRKAAKKEFEAANPS